MTRTRQVGGDHYVSHTIQPWDVIEVYGLDFWEGNALKYLLRDKPDTDRVQDLNKAIHYLEKCIERLETAEAARARREEDLKVPGGVASTDPAVTQQPKEG